MEETLRTHSLVRQLSDIRTELSVIIRSNNKTIVPGLLENNSVNAFGTLTNKIIIETDKLRAKLDQLENKKKIAGSGIDFEIEVEKMNWHNSILEKIKKLHELKYDLLGEFEKKIL